MFNWRFAACVAVLFSLFVSSVTAEPSLMAKHQDWSVFTDRIKGEEVCYAATRAKDKAPRSVEHGEVWFYVSNWRSGRARSQPSLSVGYGLRADLPSKARVGTRTWDLFNDGREAFAKDNDDAKLVGAIKRGLELRVEAISDRNTATAYHFSLRGSGNAIEKAEQACR